MEKPDQTRTAPPRDPKDLSDLMTRLALIRAEVERENPTPRLSGNLLRMFLVLLALVLLPLLMVGPCGWTTGSGGIPREEMRERLGGEIGGPSSVTPRPGQ